MWLNCQLADGSNLLRGLGAEEESAASIMVGFPGAIVLGVGPQEVAEWAALRDFQESIDRLDLVESYDLI